MLPLNRWPIMSPKSAAPATTSTDEPSSLVKASPLLMKCYALGVPIQELERQARGAERLKEAFSSIPLHRQRAEKNPDYWNEFYDCRINS